MKSSASDWGVTMDTHHFEADVQLHLDGLPSDVTADLRAKFQQDQVVKLGQLVPPHIVDALQHEAHHLLDASGKRRELTLAATGGTPRSYTSVERDIIHHHNGSIRKFFESEALRDYLENIVGEAVFRVPYEPEEYIINSQNQSGDTHGWHFDDYTYALIWLVDSPGPFDGGRVEFVNFTEWDKAAPRDQLVSLLCERTVQSLHIPAGSCYIMKARYALHRVAPILNDAKRTVIVFTFASQADLDDQTISHENMEKIYELPEQVNILERV
jgi:hypothetical protein